MQSYERERFGFASYSQLLRGLHPQRHGNYHWLFSLSLLVTVPICAYCIGQTSLQQMGILQTNNHAHECVMQQIVTAVGKVCERHKHCYFVCCKLTTNRQLTNFVGILTLTVTCNNSTPVLQDLQHVGFYGRGQRR